MALRPRWHAIHEIVPEDKEEVADAKLWAVLSAELGSQRVVELSFLPLKKRRPPANTPLPLEYVD